MATCQLGVEVVSAHDLKRPQGISPYVVLKFDRQHFRTSTKENDPNPVWNERFYFDVSDPSNLPKLFLKATIYHDTRSKNDWRGRTIIQGTSFVPLPNAVIVPYPLKRLRKLAFTHGELRLKVYIIDEASIRASYPLPAMDSAICSILRGESSPQDIPFQRLKEITNNFSYDRVLGQGGSGVVYKGVLHNGEMIAVKKIGSSLRLGLQKQFENEVHHLMMLKHPNIVRFVGYCYETRHECLVYNGERVFADRPAEMLLCLEYLPKGSLDNYLSDESSGLDWSTRYNIIKGICYGLRYLHDGIDKPITHLDLKPANILLDDNMVPKVTDFGLSRLLDEQTICTTSRAGTLGYMAPEFLHTGTLTPKSDIFSLGVIIIEILTGHRDYPDVARTPSDDFIKLTLRKWRNVLQRSPGYESLETDCEKIKRCLQVGLICVNPEHTERPPITKVISMMQGSESIDCDISIAFQHMCVTPDEPTAVTTEVVGDTASGNTPTTGSATAEEELAPDVDIALVE